MLRINLEIVPLGEEGHKKSLGEMIIGNVGRDDADGWKYVVILDGDEVGHVRNFDCESGPWALTQEAISILPAKLRQGLNPEPDMNARFKAVSIPIHDIPEEQRGEFRKFVVGRKKPGLIGGTEFFGRRDYEEFLTLDKSK